LASVMEHQLVPIQRQMLAANKNKRPSSIDFTGFNFQQNLYAMLYRIILNHRRVKCQELSLI